MQRNIAILLLLVVNLCAKAQSITQSSWQQSVDYTIDVSLDDVQHMLDGNIEIVYYNNSPDELNYIYMHLWPNGYKNNQTAFAKQMQENGELDFYYSQAKDRGYIDNIAFKVDDESTTHEVTENIDVVKVKLVKPLKSGQSVTLSTPFRVKLPKVFSRLGHKEQDYFITQWYPKPAVYDVNGWNPMPYLNMGEFYSEFGSFEVNVTLPENYTIVATGECQNEDELSSFKKSVKDTLPVSSKTTKTVKFTAKDVHDFAWFASKRWGYVTKKLDVEGREVLARVVAARPNVSDLEHIETAVSYYSEHVGAYPYSHVTVVHGELKAGGGMEYPMITLCDFMNEEVIVHEVGHNWFYGILANNERRYPWMDESINSYYEGEAMRRDGGSGLDINGLVMGALVSDNVLRNEHQAINSSSEELTNGNYGMSVYGIGATSFGYLKAFLGDSIFKECMTTYFDEWKYKHPLPGDMKASFEKTSKKSLGWFFDDLLAYSRSVDFSVSKTKQGFILENKSDIGLPLPVKLNENGADRIKWYDMKPNEKRNVLVSAKDRSALADPSRKTIDMNYGNNASDNPIKFKIGSGIDKPGVREVYVVPTFGWNYYDKAMWGLGIHNYALSNKKLQYHLFPMYSFEQKSVNGTAGMVYTKPLKGAAEYMEIGADAKSFNYQERGGREAYKYAKVSPYVKYYLPKKSQRSLVERSFKLQYDIVGLSPQFEIERDTLRGPNSYHQGGRQFATLEYNYENKKAINGFSWQVLAEYGQVSMNNVMGDTANPQPLYDILDSSGNVVRTINYFPFLDEQKESNDFLKLHSTFTYNADIGIKDKPLIFRVYGVVTFKNLDGDGQYQNTVGSVDKAGYYDYRFDDYLMHRNADVGLFQNQVSNRRDFSKFVGPIVDNETWLVSANVSVPLPGKLPIRPYAEFLMYEDLDKESWNSKGSKLIYNVGVELEIVPDRFEIFFNLAQSKDVTDYQDQLFEPARVAGFAERITFVLDLNGLMPNKLKKNLKLF